MLDKIDRQLIELLRQDARLSYRELGEQVALSANTVADRVRRLIAENILLGFSAKVNFAALDLKVQAVIDVKMLPSTSAAYFENAIGTIPGIVEATLTTGSYDYILRVVCPEHADLVQLIETLRARAGVQDTHSRVVLRQLDVNAPLR
jgi:Lrp/AsnC family leucine-responsive transcriptional regulator